MKAGTFSTFQISVHPAAGKHSFMLPRYCNGLPISFAALIYVVPNLRHSGWVWFGLVWSSCFYFGWVELGWIWLGWVGLSGVGFGWVGFGLVQLFLV